MTLNLNDYITTKDDPEELFQLLEKLGQGTYGSVYKALHKDSGKIVAAKIISIDGDVERYQFPHIVSKRRLRFSTSANPNTSCSITALITRAVIFG